MLFLLSGAAASGKKTVARQLITRLTTLSAHHENEIPATTGQTRME
jgi:guanylate kinase